MKRVLGIVALTVITVGFVYTVTLVIHDMFTQGLQDPALYQKTGAIVRLVHDDKTFCTGTIVTDHLLITAAHCAAAAKMFQAPIEVRGHDNVDLHVAAYVNYSTPQMDQAILVGDFTRFEHKPIHTSPSVLETIGVPGKILISCGYPLNGDLFCTQEVYKQRYAFFWEVTGILMPGMSGGPTMLPDGSVVAVNVAVEGASSMVSPLYNLTKNIRRDK